MELLPEEIKFVPQKPEFLMAISDPQQLREWAAVNTPLVGVCMAGRSNVGKSSLINALFGKKTARVAKEPGRTRQVLIFQFFMEGDDPKNPTPLYLFDLPGFGYAKVPQDVSRNWDILLPLFFEKLSPYLCLLILQDARHPQQKADLQFQNFIRSYSPDSILLFNKLDKLKTQKDRSILEKGKEQIYRKNKWVKQIHFISAVHGTGLPELHMGLRTHLLLRMERLKMLKNPIREENED